MRCDHIEPVVDVSGFEDWNTYIERLFGAIPGGIQHLCISCHQSKTASERLARAQHKQEAS